MMIKEKYLDEFRPICTYTPEEIQAWAKEKSVLENRELQTTLMALAYIGNDQVISSETEAEYIRRQKFNSDHSPEMHIPEPQYIPKDVDNEVAAWLKENRAICEKSQSKWMFWVLEKSESSWLQRGLRRSFYRYGWDAVHLGD